MLKNLLKFEKEMQKKYYVLRGIDEAETMEDDSIRYIAWLKFPYYSTDSDGGFFSFFTEEEFKDYITSSIRVLTEKNIRSEHFEPCQYEEFYEDNCNDEFNIKKVIQLYRKERRKNLEGLIV